MFKSAEIVNFAPKERKEYIKDMTTERDIKNQLAFAHSSGMQQGIEQGMEKGIEQGTEQANKKTAKSLVSLGVNLDIISKATGIPVEELEKLKS